MKKNSTKKQISKESAREIAAHLSAFLNHPELPEEIQTEFAEGINNLFNDVSRQMRGYDFAADYLENLILAKSGVEMDTREINRRKLQTTVSGGEQAEQPSNLPALLSAVIMHPDLPNHSAEEIWSVIEKYADIDKCAPEYLALALNLKTRRETKPVRIEPRVSHGDAWLELKKEINYILDDSQFDDEFMNALIRCFGIIKRQDKLEYFDLCGYAQSYLFSCTMAFEKIADDYSAGLFENEAKETAGKGSTIITPPEPLKITNRIDPHLSNQ